MQQSIATQFISLSTRTQVILALAVLVSAMAAALVLGLHPTEARMRKFGG